MFTSLIRKIRVEDFLAASFTISLLAIAGFGATFRNMQLTEENYWEMSFVVAPLSLLVFVASVQYALKGGKVWFSRTMNGITDAIRDWSPFLCFLLAYEAFRLQIWATLLPTDRDELLMKADRLLFGETPSILLQPIITAPLTNLLSLAYLSHLILPPLIAYILYLKDRRLFRRFLLAILMSGMIGFIGYLAIPAVGPGIAFDKAYHVDLSGRMATSLLLFVDVARAPRDVFPSLHVAVALIVLRFSRYLGRVWFFVVLPIVIANCFSTIYLRYHYLVDVIAGAILAIIVIRSSKSLLALEERLQFGR